MYNWNVFFDFFGGGIVQQFVDVLYGLMVVCCYCLFVGFQVVEFFEDGYWNDDVVFFEVEEGVGIVDQDVGVEDVYFFVSLWCFGYRWCYFFGGLVVIGILVCECCV